MAAEHRRSWRGVLLLVVTAVTSGLAMGAVWTLLMRLFGIVDPAFVLLIACGMILVIRSTTARRGFLAGLLAALGTAIAACYAECLGALGRLAWELGLPLSQVLGATNPAAAMQWGLQSTSPTDLVWYGTAALVALAGVWQPWRKKRRPIRSAASGRI